MFAVPKGIFFVRGGAVRFSEDFQGNIVLYLHIESVNYARICARNASNMHET